MNVSQLLDDVYSGHVVLPDFQRSFIWEPEDVRELLVSVLGNYFIGSMLVLEKYREDSPFALRLIEGVEKVNENAKIQSIVKIILDGQQRTSALFYALYEPDLPLKNRKNPYRFYLDIEKALEKDWDDAVIAVSILDKKRLSEIEKNENIIPFKLVLDIGKLVEKFKENPRLSDIVNFVNDFTKYEINVVSLSPKTDLNRIVETFERINRTGEPLSVFELLTAKLYRDKIKLRDLSEIVKASYTFANVMPPEFILKVVCLLRGKEPKRKNILELEPQNFEDDWKRACLALENGFKRITDVKNGYGVLDFKKWMPYTTMLTPLAAAIDYLKANKQETKKNYDKMDCWYWFSIFSNRYDEAADTKSAQDYAALRNWFNDDSKVPKDVQDFKPDGTDLDIENQSSAIYRGVMNFIVLKGALDFKTGQPPQFEKEKIQDDHIFPKSIYKYNCIPNRTLISTNTEKWKTKPSEYFKERLAEHGKDKYKLILQSHLIPEDALDCLLNDELEKFVEKRKQAVIAELTKKLALPCG
jgi:hypothetical protein